MKKLSYIMQTKISFHIFIIVWYCLNARLGKRRYLKVGEILYIKEGYNKPEIFSEHLKKYHPEQFKSYKGIK